MPLNPNAKLSDAITFLTDTQGINQKAELASVIGSPAAASDNVATQITKLQSSKQALATNVTAKGVAASPTDTFAVLANKIGQINVGKKWASGTTTVSPENIYVTVNNLTFSPSIIVFRFSEPELASEIVCLTLGKTTTSKFIGTKRDNSTGDGAYTLPLDSDEYVNNTGFKIYVQHASWVIRASTIVSWYVYE